MMPAGGVGSLGLRPIPTPRFPFGPEDCRAQISGWSDFDVETGASVHRARIKRSGNVLFAQAQSPDLGQDHRKGKGSRSAKGGRSPSRGYGEVAPRGFVGSEHLVVPAAFSRFKISLRLLSLVELVAALIVKSPEKLVLRPRQEQLLKLLRDQGSMAPADLWAALGVSRQGAMDLLRPLIQGGLVEKVGGKKTGRYSLMKP